MAGINDLTIELYELIFRNNLSISDLFNCRLVNKKFKLATYESVQKLMIGKLDEFDRLDKLNLRNDRWFHSNEFINDDHVISLECLREIRSRSTFNLDKYLKYLKINFNNDNYNEFKIELSNLNNLINLECLEVNSTFDYDYDIKLNINLKNLEYFKLNVRYLEDACELNTPKLRKIQFYSFKIKDRPQILMRSNPESVKHLITNNYDNGLKQFKNLEIIEFTSGFKLNKILLSSFKNLKKLNIFNCYNLERSFNLIKILKEFKELDRDFYINGIQMRNEVMLNEYKMNEDNLYSKNILNFQLHNYDQLDLNIPTITKLNYSKLNNICDNLRNNLPSSFFIRFQNITDVFVDEYKNDKTIDVDDLNWFLNNLKCLQKLKISNVSLDQHFFNNLPITIRILDIYNDHTQSLNFDFIPKLTKLIRFQQDGWSIDLFDLALTSILNLKYLKRFTFFNNQIITIKKQDKSYCFDTSRYGDSIVKLDYDQLVSECNRFRSENKNLKLEN